MPVRAAWRSATPWGCLGVYLVALGILVAGGAPAEEPLVLLVIFGLGLPGLALLACRGAPQPGATEPVRAGEAWLLLALFVYVSAFLALKGPLLDALLPADPDVRLRDAVNALLKLAAFVAVPLLAYRWRYGALPAPGPRTLSTRHGWLVFLLLSVAITAAMLAVSNGTRALLEPHFTATQRLVGLGLCFAWMALEVGVVEEVFFRWLLQSRLAALTGSQSSAVLPGALLFGLAHAPGMVLRGAGAIEGLGDHPTALTAIAYSITTQGVAGLLFAVLWARTRSLLLVIGLHAVVDASSNTADFIATWQL